MVRFPGNNKEKKELRVTSPFEQGFKSQRPFELVV
jgi:hypothetical protein